MSHNANFLFEIGTEEIPAGYLQPAINFINEIIKKKLDDNKITYKHIETYATPRRIVVLGYDIAESQNADEIEIKGPSAKAAYDSNSNPTKAMEGFLKGNELRKEDTFIKKTDKGEYIYAIKKIHPKKTEEILPSLMEFIVTNIAFPKKMRWSDKKIGFARPIKYFVFLFNDKKINLEIEGIKASNFTRGHYIQHNKMLEIKSINDYEKTLNQNGVIFNNNKRKNIIRDELLKAAQSLNAELVQDEELLETVTYLVENPNIVICEFDKRFLQIPDVVLITEMKEHQKYFALKDKTGKLLPNFLVVSNNPSTPFVKAGNARVITARFNDATFFFNEDRKVKLIDMVDSLKSVLFHKELGSIYDKVERMLFIANFLCDQLKLDNSIKEKIKRAILLSKVDLNTAMVFEFTSLQGIMGKIYALLDGEDIDVAEAIENHYKPKSQNDVLPTNIVSIIVSLAEKIDNLYGTFSVGNIPKGSEDPYALRRQANAVVEILLKNNIRLNIKDILNHVSIKYRNGETLLERLLEFIGARAKTIFQENGFRYDEIDACLSIKYYDYVELFYRAKSINEFRISGNFSEMLLSLKRMNNILSKFYEKNTGYSLKLQIKLLVEPAEKELYEFFSDRKDKIENFINTNKYTELFKLLIDGKNIIDNFFNNVMVMSDKTEIRDNRLALLESIILPFKNLLDFSKISD